MKTQRSSTLESSGRFKMGLKLSRLSGFRPGFFRMGVIAASLHEEGTEPVLKQVFMKLVMIGMREGRQT